MRKSAVLKILAVALAGGVACSASFAAHSHSSHGGHGGGSGRSHGGGSHGGGSHGGGHSGGGFHIGRSHGNGGGGFGGGRRSGFSGNQRSVGRGSSRGPGFFSSGHGSRDSGFGRNSSSGANRASNGRAAFAGAPGRSGFVSGNFSPNSSRSRSSSGPNRPPSASRNSYFSAREGRGSSQGSPSRRLLSSDVVRLNTRTASTNRSTPSRTSVIAARDMNRVNSFGANRPPYARSQINAAERGNVHSAGISYSTANRGRSNFGNSRFGGYHPTNASISSLGSGRFEGRSSDFGRGGFQSRDRGYNRFGHNGFGRNRFGYGGYGRRGFGDGGSGYGRGYGGGDDFWIFGDLFGLAFDFGRFAWSPWAPLGLAGFSLLENGIQVLDGLDNQQSYANEQQAYAPLCGTYYSEENPGCLQ